MRKHYRVATLVAMLVTSGLAGCATVPDYKRAEIDVPQSWPTSQTVVAGAKSAAEAGEKWWTLYEDPVLNQLEEDALANNADIQVAAARVLEVRAQLGITEAGQSPTLDANLSANRTQSSMIGTTRSGSARTQNNIRATLDAQYELDLWGKLRLATKAARAELLSAESAKESVRLSLTAQVAQQYFNLLSLDAQSLSVQRILSGRQQRLALDRKRLEVGAIAEFDIHQSEAEEGAAQSQLAALKQATDKQEAALVLLLGHSPRDVMDEKIARGTPALASVSLPEGLPSELLLRRPDLQEAEQDLIALNARIGVVRARVFPSISLTAYLGNESTTLAQLFSGPAGVFQFAGSVGQTIFNGGLAKHGIEAAEARRDQALIQYKRAVANAFMDVRNALAAQSTAQQVLAIESRRSAALSQAYQQAKSRYEGGISSRLEYLDIERAYLLADLNRLDAERAQRVAAVDIFKALGGGWLAKAPESDVKSTPE